MRFRGFVRRFHRQKPLCRSDFLANSLRKLTGKKCEITGIENPGTGNFQVERKRPFLTRLFLSRFERDLFSPTIFQVENEMSSARERYGEAFWRAHHEAWVQSELNQREYCEAHGIPLRAFDNWRVKFKAEPQTPSRKVLYLCLS